MGNIKHITSIHDAVTYWNDCLHSLSTKSDQEVAYDIVNIVNSPKFNDWYSGDHKERMFAAIYDYASDLELPQGDKRWRAYRWQRIKKLVGELSDKYCQKQ